MENWLIKIDAAFVYQALIQAVVFLVYFVLLKTLFFDKVAAMMDKRQNQITEDLDSAAEQNAAAARLEASYQEKITNIDNERFEILKAASKDGETVKEKIVSDAQSQAASLIEAAKKEAEAQKKRAQEEFMDTFVELTIDTAEKVVGKSLNKADHMKLIGDSINQFKEV